MAVDMLRRIRRGRLDPSLIAHMASVLALGLVGAQGFATAPHSEIPTEVCTPAGYTISCAHSECENYVPGTCYAINEVSQQLVPNGNACVPAGNTLMMQAALLWNNRDGRGIPAIRISGIGRSRSRARTADPELGRVECLGDLHVFSSRHFAKPHLYTTRGWRRGPNGTSPARLNL